METKKENDAQTEKIFFNPKLNRANIVFEEVNISDLPIERQLIIRQEKMGLRIQSVAIPNGYSLGIKSEKEQINWLYNIIKSRYTASRIYFMKYNVESQREDWQNNKAVNRRFSYIKNLYKNGLNCFVFLQKNS